MLYGHLDNTKHQIRLLHLAAGSPKEELSCTFSVISLDDDIEYEALSYVWGDANDTIPIQFEHQPTLVTRNLHSALTSLRLLDRERILWVDALCINQSDLVERSSQVAQMRSLYSKASCVVCYLGNSWEGADMVIDVMKTVAEDQDLHIDSSKTPSWGVDKVDFTSLSLRKNIIRFMNSPWWTRMWTTQEILLASCASLHFGSYSIPFDTVLSFYYHIMSHGSNCCIEIATEFLSLPPNESSEVGVSPSLVPLGSLAGFMTMPHKPTFLYMLNHFRLRKATDPRDKVYGVLGLARQTDPGLVQPDYTLSPQDVFLSVVRKDFEGQQCLNFLSYCFEKSALELPSWVPDWSSSTIRYMLQAIWLDSFHHYNANGGRKANAKITGDIEATTLRADGVIFDEIAECSQILNFMDSDFADQVNIVTKLSEIADLDRGGRSKYPNSSQTVDEAFLLSMCGGLGKTNFTARGHQRIDKISTEHSQVWETMKLEDEQLAEKSLSELSPEAYVIFSLYLYIPSDRRFVKTSKGYFGFGTKNCRQGDVVAVLGGGKVPYILRPILDGPSNGRQYMFLGDAYIHGIMDGEAFQGSDVKMEEHEII